MKVLFITTSLNTGGAEMMLLKLLEGIDRSRFEPHVICLMHNGEIGTKIAKLGIPVEAINLHPALPNPLKLWHLKSRIKSIKPQIIQTWMYHADLLGGLCARYAGSNRLVWGIRNSNLDPKLVKPTTRLVAKVCARLSGWLPNRILSCSDEARNRHVALGYEASKFEVIANGFNLKSFRPDDTARGAVRAALGLNSNTLLVGLIARYDPLKNHEGFLRAAAIIRDSVPDVQFLLAGGGIDSNNASLREAIAKLKLDDAVHLLGRRDDVPMLMAALDLLVSSSHGEAFPNVLGEAMACGVPCVVTDAGDSAQIVGDTGEVVAVGDMAGLAQKTIKLLTRPVQQRCALGRQARERVENRYEIGQVVTRYEQFYEQLVNGDGPDMDNDMSDDMGSNIDSQRGSEEPK